MRGSGTNWYIDLNELSISCSLWQQTSARLYGARQQATDKVLGLGRSQCTDTKNLMANLMVPLWLPTLWHKMTDWGFLGYKMVNPWFLNDKGYPVLPRNPLTYIYTPMKPYFKGNCRGLLCDILPRVWAYISLWYMCYTPHRGGIMDLYHDEDLMLPWQQRARKKLTL